MYPESDAVRRDGNLSVVHFEGSHYCGYCRMPRLMAESGYDGLLRYVPVHGGITYAAKSETGQMVYGFDCAHAGDETNLWWHDPQAVLDEARNMSRGIWIATLFEPFYLLPLDRKWTIRIPLRGGTLRLSYTLVPRWKAHVIDAYHWACGLFGIEFELTDNFGAMIALMFGEL